MFIKKTIFISLLFCTVNAMAAQVFDSTEKTRFGTLGIKTKEDVLTVYFNNAKIATAEANSFNGFDEAKFKIGENDVLVLSALAGGGCGSYSFVTVTKKSATVSPSFSSCGEVFFKQKGNVISSKTMDSEGKILSKIVYKDGVVYENGKEIRPEK